MVAAQSIRTGRAVLFAMRAKLVWVTLKRGNVLTSRLIGELEPVLAKVVADFQAELIAFEAGPDWVSISIDYPIDMSISKLTNSCKAVSSRRLKKVPGSAGAYHKGSLWSPSYLAISIDGGSGEAEIRKFLER